MRNVFPDRRKIRYTVYSKNLRTGALHVSKIQWKGGTLLGPLPPALIYCGTAEHPNVFTAAWTGIVNTIPPKTYVSIRPSR